MPGWQTTSRAAAAHCTHRCGGRPSLLSYRPSTGREEPGQNLKSGACCRGWPRSCGVPSSYGDASTTCRLLSKMPFQWWRSRRSRSRVRRMPPRTSGTPPMLAVIVCCGLTAHRRRCFDGWDAALNTCLFEYVTRWRHGFAWWVGGVGDAFPARSGVAFHGLRRLFGLGGFDCGAFDAFCGGGRRRRGGVVSGRPQPLLGAVHAASVRRGVWLRVGSCSAVSSWRGRCGGSVVERLGRERPVCRGVFGRVLHGVAEGVPVDAFGTGGVWLRVCGCRAWVVASGGSCPAGNGRRDSSGRWGCWMPAGLPVGVWF